MLLSQGRYYSVQELSEELGIELRTVYRYVEDLKASKFFKFVQRGRVFRLSRSSVFWNGIVKNNSISDAEVEALYSVLEGIESDDAVLTRLKSKLAAMQRNKLAPLPDDADETLKQCALMVKEAIEQQQMCILRGYTSLNSGTKSDRVVEPFCFIDTMSDVRCYELSSQQCKTFKLSRCNGVEVLPVKWQFAPRHKEVFVDIFKFSGEEKTRVRLLLGQRSKTLLLEEYPHAQACLIPQPDGRWLFDAEYCSMKGVGRFYLGLYDDIEIVKSPEFEVFIAERVAELNEKVKK